MYPDQEQARPYGSPPTARVFMHHLRHDTPRLVKASLFFGILGIAMASASLTLLLSFKTTTGAQISQLRQELIQVQESATGNAGSVSGKLNALHGQLSNISAAMATIAPFTQVCSQDLTGPNGPAQFYFQCTDQKP